jgi:hypothetical protein
MNRIIVGRRTEPNAIYCGRPSPLGNPFVPTNHSLEERNRVCDLYDEWIKNQIKNQNVKVINEIKRIYQLLNASDIILGCFCSPKRCHCDSIKSILEKMQRCEYDVQQRF